MNEGSWGTVEPCRTAGCQAPSTHYVDLPAHRGRYCETHARELLDADRRQRHEVRCPHCSRLFFVRVEPLPW